LEDSTMNSDRKKDIYILSFFVACSLILSIYNHLILGGAA